MKDKRFKIEEIENAVDEVLSSLAVTPGSFENRRVNTVDVTDELADTLRRFGPVRKKALELSSLNQSSVADVASILGRSSREIREKLNESKEQLIKETGFDLVFSASLNNRTIH